MNAKKDDNLNDYKQKKINPNLIKGFRNHLGFTQAELAKVLGISVVAYRNKENGITEFSDSEKRVFTGLVRQLFPEESIESIFFSNRYEYEEGWWEYVT